MPLLSPRPSLVISYAICGWPSIGKDSSKARRIVAAPLFLRPRARTARQW